MGTQITMHACTCDEALARLTCRSWTPQASGGRLSRSDMHMYLQQIQHLFWQDRKPLVLVPNEMPSALVNQIEVLSAAQTVGGAAQGPGADFSGDVQAGSTN